MTILEWLGCIGGLTAMLSLSLRLRNAGAASRRYRQDIDMVPVDRIFRTCRAREIRSGVLHG
jgi:hypothetical protein